MATYEQVLEEIKNRYELGLITESQAHRYLDLLEEKTYVEGANLDIRAVMKQHKSQIKEQKNIAKKAIKIGDYSKAKKAVATMKKEIEATVKAVDAIESTAGSAAIGLFVSGIPTFCTDFLEILPAFGIYMAGASLSVYGTASTVINGAASDSDKMAIGVGGATTMGGAIAMEIINLKHFIEKIIVFIDGVKDKGLNADTLNLYKNNTKVALKRLSQACDRLEKIIDKAAKESKKERNIKDILKKKETVKESVSDELSDLIEEAYMNDIINTDEFMDLMESASEEDVDYVTAYIEASM